jgi:hypothetical protein
MDNFKKYNREKWNDDSRLQKLASTYITDTKHIFIKYLCTRDLPSDRVTEFNPMWTQIWQVCS